MGCISSSMDALELKSGSAERMPSWNPTIVLNAFGLYSHSTLWIGRGQSESNLYHPATLFTGFWSSWTLVSAQPFKAFPPDNVDSYSSFSLPCLKCWKRMAFCIFKVLTSTFQIGCLVNKGSHKWDSLIPAFSSFSGGSIWKSSQLIKPLLSHSRPSCRFPFTNYNSWLPCRFCVHSWKSLQWDPSGGERQGVHFSGMRNLSCRQKHPQKDREGARAWTWRSVQ